MLRWISPIKNMARTVVDDVELRGETLHAGDQVILMYPSANRDNAAFEDPMAFRIDRKPNRQLAFGYGPHVCLGQFLAKMEIRILFAELLARIDDIALDGDPAWVKANFVSGLKRLPIRYRSST